MRCYQHLYPDSKDRNSVQSGYEYQDFVLEQCMNIGLVLTYFQSRKYQFERGEGKIAEVKLDTNCTSRGSNKPRRLSIEVAEKSRKDNAEFVPSGIYKDDETWLYIQGNWNIIYIFARKDLIALHRTGRYEEHTEPTLRGFFLEAEEARDVALKVIIPEKGVAFDTYEEAMFYAFENADMSVKELGDMIYGRLGIKVLYPKLLKWQKYARENL